MPDWLQSTTAVLELDITPQQLAARLLLATLAGAVVAGICYAAHGRRKADAPMLLTTLVLLTVLIAMVTLVIGNSVARAFGLVGALSIVRFRTVVDDTRDTAFVIFAVIVGMAIGAGALLVPLIGVPLVGLVAIVLDRLRAISLPEAPTHRLVVRMGLGRDPATVLDPVLDRHTTRRFITASSTSQKGAALDVTYRLHLPSDSSLPRLVAELNQLDGVQSVELTVQ
uniref:DUF4956 domain-containing protein n=1 Tax=Schlesneria paludicola TaxID=360056 RepID=A0A7C2NXE9_9PLAN